MQPHDANPYDVDLEEPPEGPITEPETTRADSSEPVADTDDRDLPGESPEELGEAHAEPDPPGLAWLKRHARRPSVGTPRAHTPRRRTFLGEPLSVPAFACAALLASFLLYLGLGHHQVGAHVRGGGRITVRVLSAARKPLPNAYVWVASSPKPLSQVVVWTRHGEATVELAAGTSWLVVADPGYRSVNQLVVISAGGTIARTVTLRPIR